VTRSVTAEAADRAWKRGSSAVFGPVRRRLDRLGGHRAASSPGAVRSVAHHSRGSVAVTRAGRGHRGRGAHVRQPARPNNPRRRSPKTARDCPALHPAAAPGGVRDVDRGPGVGIGRARYSESPAHVRSSWPRSTPTPRRSDSTWRPSSRVRTTPSRSPTFQRRRPARRDGPQLPMVPIPPRLRPLCPCTSSTRPEFMSPPWRCASARR
jgi:hypothetical protein